LSGKRTAGAVGRFFRDYTGGLRVSDIVRELERDASHSYQTLTREHAAAAEPAGRFGRFLYRTRIVFLGLSAKLSPARRVVFLGSLACVLLAVLGSSARSTGITQGNGFFLAAIAGLVFLLGLELADRVVVRDELEVARELQQELLPQHGPQLPGWDFAFSYRTANTIGGDYYDFIPLRDGRIAIVIGDASGHGIAAGLIMAIANSTLKLALDLDPRPAAVAGLVNRALVRTGSTRDFMTLFVALLEPRTGEFEYVCAGHPFPLIRCADGSLEELGAGSLPLGMFEDVKLDVGRANVGLGDLVVLYSDGIPEAVNSADHPYGFERIRAQLTAGGSAREIHDRLLRSVNAFRGERPLVDDMSLVVFTRSAAPTSEVPSNHQTSTD
jgi:hypothetical protein